jgi:uncharacterized Fe-S cluster protein YjdI
MILIMDEERMETKDREYTNGEITVKWQPSKCIHVTTCYRELIEVFNPRKRPWVNMKGASTDEIIRVVNMCPTQALSYYRNENKKEGTTHDMQAETKQTIEIGQITEVKVMKDGPLIIKGSFKIIGSEGSELKHMKMATFCRCGNSKKMPFCDGSHRKIGFSAD